MMKYIDNINFLTPMMSTNKRREILCVDFNDYIRCESEATFYKILELYEANDEILNDVSTDVIESALNIGRDATFELCAMYLPLHLIAYLLPDADVDKLTTVYEKTLAMWNSPLYYHNTRYCAIIKNLLTNNSIPYVYLVKEKFEEDDFKYLWDIFGEYCNDRIKAIEGNYMDALNTHDDITFFMIRQDSFLVDVLKSEDTSKLEDKCFLLSATSCNIRITDTGSIEFKNKELFNNASNVYIYTTFLYPMKEDTEDSVG